MTSLEPASSAGSRRHTTGLRPRFRGLIHLLAFSSALTLAPILVVTTPGVAPRFIMAIYAFAIVGLFGVSAIYHRHDWSPTGSAVIRRIDHSMIFLATAATHTPIALLALPTTPGWVLFGIVWGGAAIGIAARILFSHAPYAIIAFPYVLVGWSSVFVIDHVWASLPVAAFVLLLVGGLLYTVGAVIYAKRRPNPWPASFGYHEIFHTLTVAAAACHYVVIAIFVRDLV